METIYLDYNATAPLLTEARKAVESVLELGPVNASSVHRHGRVARRVVEEARAEVALLLEVEEAEI